MKALVCPSLGQGENLLVTEVEAPRAGDGEALVEIAYAGLNFFDTLIIEGEYQVRPKPPFSPGGEFSATWSRSDRGAQGFAVGDRVIGACAYGAAAEQIAIPTTRLVKIPDGLALDKAAGLFGHFQILVSKPHTWQNVIMVRYLPKRQNPLVQPGVCPECKLD